MATPQSKVSIGISPGRKDRGDDVRDGRGRRSSKKRPESGYVSPIEPKALPASEFALSVTATQERLGLAEDESCFGTPVLDERLGSWVRAGLNALIGGTGTGKTVAALHFLNEGVRQGGQVAHLTEARPEDVMELARSIGVDLSTHLHSGRWRIFGYQPRFRVRYRRTLEPKELFDEFRGFLTEGGRPDRVLIDTCGPLVESREAGIGAELLLELLEDLETTSLLTFAAENPAVLNNGFEFVSQRASLVLHLMVTNSGRREFVVRKTPGPLELMGPIRFDIREGQGIVRPPW